MDQTTIGWREWLALPELQVPAIKAKIDTGARNSALHAFSVVPFTKENRQMVRFGVHSLQKRLDVEIICEAPINNFREVSDSGGHREMRYVTETTILIGDLPRQTEMPVDLTPGSRRGRPGQPCQNRGPRQVEITLDDYTSNLTEEDYGLER